MDEKEIREQIDEHINELARLSQELLKEKKQIAVVIQVEVANMLGTCHIYRNVMEPPKEVTEKVREILGALEEGIPEGQEQPKQAPAEVVEDFLKQCRKNFPSA